MGVGHQLEVTVLMILVYGGLIVTMSIYYLRGRCKR